MDIYAALLAACPGFGSGSIRSLIKFFGGARRVWKAGADELKAAHILTPKRFDKLLSFRNTTGPEAMEQAMKRGGMSCVTWQEEAYPSLLIETANPPAVLFYQGTLPKSDWMISVVGSRKPTAYGIQTAERLAEELSSAGVIIVSGGARGIDSAAHRGCLRGKSPTVAVAACGLDRIYPPENRNLFQQIQETGCILSEYPPGTPPLGRQFPARNRIIAGLSRGVLVVEAAQRSGSLITSDFALEEGRDVFSVPGNIWMNQSKGTNHLIRNGAVCVTEAADILSEYGWKTEESAKPADKEELTLEEELVYRFCCTGDEVSEEDILQQSGLSMVKLKITLLSLQLKGYIQEVGPGHFISTGQG